MLTAPGQLTVIAAGTVMLWLCSAGFYVEPLQSTSESLGCGDQTVLRLAGLPRCGALRVEASKGALLSPEPHTVLVLPDAAAIAELRQLESAISAGTARACRTEVKVLTRSDHSRRPGAEIA